MLHDDFGQRGRPGARRNADEPKFFRIAAQNVQGLFADGPGRAYEGYSFLYQRATSVMLRTLYHARLSPSKQVASSSRPGPYLMR